MNFNDYQVDAVSLAQYPHRGQNLLYPALGLAGEAGEAADKVKKYYRNTGGEMTALNMSGSDKLELTKELGDTLWYIAALADEIGVTLEDVAQLNLHKLKDRLNRGVLLSSGDNR